MTRRKRMAGGAIGLVAVVWVIFALAAPAQDGIPKWMPPLKSTPIEPMSPISPTSPIEPGELLSLELPPDDGDEILPAQFITPLGPSPE